MYVKKKKDIIKIIKMNKKDLIIKEKENYGNYHIPGCANYIKRPKNAIFISTSNSREHELLKAEECYNLRELGYNFITEAVRNKKDSKGKSRRVDIVNITLGEEIEIECDMKRAIRFLDDKKVSIIPCDWRKTDKKWMELCNKIKRGN